MSLAISSGTLRTTNSGFAIFCSIRTRMTVEDLAGLSFGAKLSGTELEAAAGTIAKLSVSIGNDSCTPSATDDEIWPILVWPLCSPLERLIINRPRHLTA